MVSCTFDCARSFPHIIGYQGAGLVEAVGQGVTQVRVGQRVVAFNWSGSHAEIFAVPEHFVYPIPGNMSFELASTIPVAFGTAHDSLFEFGRLRAGETVLIQGAAGGVGIAALQLAKAAGATVIGTSSTGERSRMKPAPTSWLTSRAAKASSASWGGCVSRPIVDRRRLERRSADIGIL